MHNKYNRAHGIFSSSKFLDNLHNPSDLPVGSGPRQILQPGIVRTAKHNPNVHPVFNLVNIPAADNRNKQHGKRTEMLANPDEHPISGLHNIHNNIHPAQLAHIRHNNGISG